MKFGKALVAAAGILLIAVGALAAPTGHRTDTIARLETVLMMPLSSLGSTEQALRAVERILVQEMQQILGARLLFAESLPHRGDGAAEAIDACDGEIDCLLEAAGAAGWHGLVVGSMAGLGSNRVISLKLYDLRTGNELQTVSEGASGEEAQLIKQMRKAVVELLAPERFVGTLVLEAAQPNVQILIDGNLVGTTPLKTSRFSVPVGRHAIEAKGEGLVPFEAMVTIAYGETKPITIDLPRNELFLGGDAPFHRRWWTWTMLAAGVVGLGLGGYFNYRQMMAAQEIKAAAPDCIQSSGSCQLDVNLYRREQTSWNLARGFYGGGGLLFGGAMFFFVLDAF